MPKILMSAQRDAAAETVKKNAMFDYIKDNKAQELAALLLTCPNGFKSLVHEGQEFVPLQEAINRGHLDIVNVLLDDGANPDQPDTDSYTPLINAVENEQWSIVDRLLEAGVNVATKTNYNHTALHGAVCHRNKNLVEKLLSLGASLECINSEKLTPLGMAIKVDDADMVKLLLSHGARLDYVRGTCGYLERAVFTSTREVALQLIKAGIDPDGGKFHPPSGKISKTAPLVTLINTPLSREDRSSREFWQHEVDIFQFTQLLLNCGADPDLHTLESKLTPMDAAVSNGRPEIISLLVAHGAGPASLSSGVFAYRNGRGVAPQAKVDAMLRSLDPVTSLQAKCRLAIRKILLECRRQGESLISNVPELPLSIPLQKYLCNIGGAGL